MITQNPTGETTKNAFSNFLKRLLIKTALSVLSVLLILSLLSHNPEDTQILDEGLGDYATIGNWIGLFGAHASRILILWIGFASYIGTVFILICVIVRGCGKLHKAFNKIYLAGIIMFIWGTSMILGVFPDFLPTWAEKLNIAKTPGGVIGQRLCAPWSLGTSHGWLTYVVNPAGSVIISTSMIIVGLVTVWYFDWQDKAKFWWDRLLEWRKEEKNQKKSKSKTKEKRVEAKWDEPAIELGRKDPEANQNQLPPDSGRVPNRRAKNTDNMQIVSQIKSESSENSPTFTYRIPSFDLLASPAANSSIINPKEIEIKKVILQDTLDSFSIDAAVGATTSGPRVTLFEIKPAAGVKVEKISSLANNISMNLKAESLRILTPIPGKDTVGIEVPNRISSSVGLRDLLQTKAWQNSMAGIPLTLGKSISGKPVILDLAKAPHLLIAGATGSGKSVCMNTLILSMLYRFSPDELKLIMIDPKVVEFSGYNTLPHLVTPVVTQVKKVPSVLRWVLNQMEWRYDILSKVGVRNLASFNARKPEKEVILDDDRNPIPNRLPFLIVIIDELADIMMTAKADVETSLARIAQLARAVGIHAVVATQRPSVNVITGIIKANFPTRIAFQVTSVVDSRTILDCKGAESLLGRGDMLFRPPGGAKLERTQGALVEDDEIERVVTFVSEQAQPKYIEDILTFGSSKEDAIHESIAMTNPNEMGDVEVEFESAKGEGGKSDEELIQRAIGIIMRDRRATTSHIQRRLRIGYNRAALIIEKLESRGIIGPQIGTAPRQILMETNDSSKDNAGKSSDIDSSIS